MFSSSESEAFFEALEDPDRTAPGPDREQGWGLLKKIISERLDRVKRLFSSTDSPADPIELFQVASQE